jgi:hypothetical protein
MIKSILVTLFSVFCLVANANANIKISPDVVEISIKQYFPKQEDSASALATFNANLESDGSISAAAIWRICIAGNLNLDDSVQKYECRKFKTALEKNSNVKYSDVCTKGFKESHAERGEAAFCIDDVFNNSLYGGTQVDLTSAIMLAKEWARINHADDSLVCENKVYKRTPKSILARASDDYTILCTSQNRKAYYEFWFDHIGESDSATIFDSIGIAMCKIFNVPDNVGLLPECHSRTPEQYEQHNWNCPPISCKTDKNKCTQINQSLAKFGYMSLYDHDTCEIYFNSVDNPKQLKTAFGINNFQFCKGIQVQNTPSLETYLQEYVAKFANVDASEVTCNPGHRSYTGPGCSKDGSDADDIKTCYVNGEQIDFVFDDINEWKDIHYLAGIQGMECIVHAGGVFDGKHCLRLTKEQCDSLQNENIPACSGCKQVEWDPVNNMCKLKYAGYANDFDKAVKVAKLAGSVLLAVYGGWVVFTAVKAGAAVVVIPVLLEAVNVGGSILEFAGTLQLKGIATEFVKQSNSCNDSNCADLLVEDWLQRLSNIREELEPAEYSAVNEELARLLKMTSQEFKENMVKDILIEYSKNANTGDVPENVQKKFQELYESPDLLESNKKGFFDKDGWEPEQVLRAVGIGLQIGATLGSAAYSWHQENKALAATRDALDEGYAGITQDPAKREAVKKQLANAKIVKIDTDSYENKLRAAYQKYAPKNQTYDDFVKMFKNEEEFDKQVAMWSSFDPVVYKENQYAPAYTISSPYSTYDPEFAKTMKDIDAKYTDDIAELDAKIKSIDDQRKNIVKEQKRLIRQEAKERIGRDVRYKDWDLEELKDLKSKDEIVSLKTSDFRLDEVPASEFSQKEMELLDEKYKLENLREGYVTARDVEKSKVINASVDKEVLGKYVTERENIMIKTIAEDDDLYNNLKNWSNISDEEKRISIQKMYDSLDKSENIVEQPAVYVYKNPNSTIRADAGRRFNLNPLGEEVSANNLPQTVLHEFSHTGDSYAPDSGMLGAQKSAIRFEGSRTDWDIYQQVPSEKISWKFTDSDTDIIGEAEKMREAMGK